MKTLLVAIGDSRIKTLLVAMCLIFAVLFGLTLYTHYDTKKFIENLPQPPATQSEVSVGEKTPTPLERETLRNEAEQTLADTGPVPYTHGDSHEHTDSPGHTHHHNSLGESTPILESDVTQHTEEAPSRIQLPPGVVAWKSVNSNGERVIDREAFLAEFGNHPKAHTYLALYRKITRADSYTNREFYEYELLEKEFTQNDFPQSYLERLRQLAERDPDGRTRSYRSLKNDPNVRIRIIDNRK